MRKLLSCQIFALVLLLNGCGYHLSATSGLPPAVVGKKIAVTIFSNRSYRANLGAIISGRLADEFGRRSGGMVVAEESADLILSGAVLNYTTSAVSSSLADKVIEYRAVMDVESTLTEKKTGRVIWKGTISWGQDYPAAQRDEFGNTNIALQQNNEEAAIREIGRKVALQVYQKISEGF